MITSNIKQKFQCEKELIWNIITDNENYNWRSDVSKIEIIDDTHFIEYAKDNYPTYFTITKKEETKEYRFDMENNNLKGTWIGLLKPSENGVLLDFTEEIEINHFLKKLLAKPYLKTMQKRYIKDLKKEIEKRMTSK